MEEHEQEQVALSLRGALALKKLRGESLTTAEVTLLGVLNAWYEAQEPAPVPLPLPEHVEALVDQMLRACGAGSQTERTE